MSSHNSKESLDLHQNNGVLDQMEVGNTTGNKNINSNKAAISYSPVPLESSSSSRHHSRYMFFFRKVTPLKFVLFFVLSALGIVYYENYSNIISSISTSAIVSPTSMVDLHNITVDTSDSNDFTNTFSSSKLAQKELKLDENQFSNIKIEKDRYVNEQNVIDSKDQDTMDSEEIDMTDGNQENSPDSEEEDKMDSTQEDITSTKEEDMTDGTQKDSTKEDSTNSEEEGIMDGPQEDNTSTKEENMMDGTQEDITKEDGTNSKEKDIMNSEEEDMTDGTEEDIINSKTENRGISPFKFDETIDGVIKKENQNKSTDNDNNFVKQKEEIIEVQDPLITFRNQFKSMEYLEKLATLRKKVEARLKQQIEEGKKKGGGTTNDDANKVENQDIIADQKATIVYIHPHKAGGSTLCKMAQTNYPQNIYGYQYVNNCLYKNHNQPADEQVIEISTLEENSNIFFLAIEKMFVAPILPEPENVAYAISMRHPIDRIMSHFYHELKSDEVKISRGEKPLYTGIKTFAEFIDERAASTTWANNFYLQMLTGCVSTDNLHKKNARGCSEEDLEFAKLLLLHYYSVVLITDNEDLYSHGSVLLERRFGWQKVDPNKDRRGTKRSSSAMEELQNGGEALYRKLYERNALDMELHHFAKGLFLNEVSFELLTAITEMEKSIDEDLNSNYPQDDNIIQRDNYIDKLFEVHTLILNNHAATKEKKITSKEASTLISTSPFRDQILSPPKLHFRGVGGHDESQGCIGYGPMRKVECQQYLIKTGCHAMTYVNGQCYLHLMNENSNFRYKTVPDSENSILQTWKVFDSFIFSSTSRFRK